MERSQVAPERDPDLDFSGILPKQEIQVSQFLQKYPNHDGRGVVIAIFDTGVDLGASGLQTTPTGERKIIDVVDCTGSNDVDTSLVVEASTDSEGVKTIRGVNGNTLRVNPSWSNPTNKWHVGVKRAFDLFPEGLRTRMKELRKRRFDEKQHQVVTAAIAALSTFNKEHPASAVAGDLSLKKQKEELEARVKLLEELAGKYDDLGPVIDCAVWHNGECWVAALDTSALYNDDEGQKGALADYEPLTNYKDCLRYATFTAEDALNYALNIYDEGNTLSIVTDTGSHGTHVAGIAAAYFPDEPALNGMAPGARIVSCKIGDTRLGSMETLVGVTRALIAVVQNKCDMINMSYGEAVSTPNIGRFVRLAEEVVNEHNVVFISSAGNSGPALSTLGAPGGTTSAAIGIGAYVTPSLAKTGHSVREKLQTGVQYTWSSRGPTADGDLGVSISAPGGAIAPVPQWTMQSKQLMNGTSMSSPAACGGIALVVSGLKANGQVVTSARIRRAVENTALAVGEASADQTLTHGYGLLQVTDAFEYLMKGAEDKIDAVLRELRINVSAKRRDGGSAGRGIYLREPAESVSPSVFQIEVKPALKRDADVRESRLPVEFKLELRTTVSWIKIPALLMLEHNGRSFDLELDPTSLGEGLHYTEVQAFIVGAEWRGPLFRVPITVIRPILLDARPGQLSLSSASPKTTSNNNQLSCKNANLELGTETFNAGKVVRRYVAVPEGATWAELKITTVSTDISKTFVVHTVALLPQSKFSDNELEFYLDVSPFSENVSPFAVTAGSTLEIVIAQYWSSFGETNLKLGIQFHGVQVSRFNRGALAIDGSSGPTKLFVRAPLRNEKIVASAKLDTVRIPLRPTDSELTPLSAPRDQLPGGRLIHRLMLTYKLSVAEAGKITPRVPMFNSFVYESEIDAQMSFILDSNKQLIGVSDIYPKSYQVKKGDYTIRLHLRHENPAFLETLRGLQITVDRAIDSAVSVPVYSSHVDAIKGENAMSKDKTLAAGEAIAVFLGLAPEDKLPKDATPGRHLVGNLTFGQTSAGKDAPGALQFVYVVPPKKTDPPAAPAGNGSPSTPLSTEDALAETIRDAQVKFLADMKTDTEEKKAAYAKLLADLKSRFPAHLPLLREPLKRLSGTAEADRTAEIRQGIVNAADAVLGAINQTDLAVALARKCPEEGPEADKKKKDVDEKKSAVIDALSAKCTALLELEAEGKASYEDFEAAFGELRRWTDPANDSDPQHAVLLSRRELRAGRIAAAFKALDKVASPDDKPATKEVLEQREKLLKELGWVHWAKIERTKITNSFPRGFPAL